MGASKYFNQEQQDRIKAAIVEAETGTSGEIRVHVESECKEDVMDHAAWLFFFLKMEKTAQRNGVLIYLAVESRKFAIIGDKGINQVVPADFWESTKEKMRTHFRQGDLTGGLAEAALEAGKQLKKFFPYQSDDVNELSDEVSFGK